MARETRTTEQDVVTPAAVFDCMVFVQALANVKGPACACYVVTWDRDLLDLMDGEVFRQQFPQLTILEPPTLLRQFPPAPAESEQV